MKALCEKHGLPYNTGGFSKQIGSVWGKLFRLALPPFLVKNSSQAGVIVMRRGQVSAVPQTEVGV